MIFREYGYRPEEQPSADNDWFRPEVNLGIPKASFRSSHSRTEIELFLSAIDKSPVSYWDFKSIKAVEFYAGKLETSFYSLMLEQICRSQSRRHWLHDTFGIEP
jgi:hypothetical protein